MKNDYKNIYRDELIRHFGSDQRRINHALRVLSFAERIAEGEGLDSYMHKVIIVTALLHDVGIKPAEQKYGSSAGIYQEQEGPPIVTEMMSRHNEPEELIRRVAYIVGGHHTAAKNDGQDFQIIWEADLLVNIEEEGLANSVKLGSIITDNFRTANGIKIAKELYPFER